jgi:L-cysteine/cystine lyase
MDSPPPASAASGLAAFRQHFPVLEWAAYMNAGTDGPLPTAAVQAAARELDKQGRTGRTAAHFEHRHELGDALRGAYAGLLGCTPAELALTTCTSEGIALVVGGMQLGPGDEILTSDEEHPGLLGALQAARDLSGVQVRTVALADLPDSVGPATKLLACSHVSWVSGALAPSALSELAGEVTILLDGAQGVGAVPVDVSALGCHAYAGAGQKWLCGPDGLGMLYVSPELTERLVVPRRGYANFESADGGLDAVLHADARRFDCFGVGAEAVACALGALGVFEQAGWEAVHARATALADELVRQLTDCGRSVVPRGQTTLVSFSSDDPEAERARLADSGVLLRDLPDRPLLRASVGAWNNEADLARLIDGLQRGQ